MMKLEGYPMTGFFNYCCTNQFIHTYIHTYVYSKHSKNKDKYNTKNALKREFERLALCKELPKEKS